MREERTWRQAIADWFYTRTHYQRRTTLYGGKGYQYEPKLGFLEKYDTDQPWVIYRYGFTHDAFWPPWRASRILGIARVQCLCAVCGRSRMVTGRIPRWGPVNPEGKRHPARIQFCLDHLHRDKPHPMAWAKPLLNPDAHPGGIDLDLLAMRLQADLEAPTHPSPKPPEAP